MKSRVSVEKDEQLEDKTGDTKYRLSAVLPKGQGKNVAEHRWAGKEIGIISLLTLNQHSEYSLKYI